MFGYDYHRRELSPVDGRIAAYAKHDKVMLSVQRNLARAHAARILLDKFEVTMGATFTLVFSGSAGYELAQGHTTNALEYLGGAAVAVLQAANGSRLLDKHQANPPEQPLFIPQEFTDEA